MRLTVTHLEFWRARKAMPSWAVLMTGQARGATAAAARQRAAAGPSVHECIAAHAGKLSNPHAMEASNLLALLRLQLHGGMPLRDALTRAAQGPVVPGFSTRRRAGYARKWLQRLQRNPGARP